MTRILTSGIIFLVCLLGLCCCSSTKSDWDYLYQMEVDTATGDASEEKDSEQNHAEQVEDEAYSEKQEKDDIKETGVAVYVHVCGAVVCPGVYVLPEGARVYEAIAAAGGLTQEADLLFVNQAKMLEDGEQIRIYTREEAKEAELESKISELEPTDGMININHATMEQLMTLPGIGEAKAVSIIEYRETNGSFQRVEDIMNIPGIKEAVFSKIKDKITV